MAIHRFQCALHNSLSGLPEDDSVNVLYYEVNAPDTVSGVADGIAQAYEDNLLQVANSVYSGMTIKWYDVAGGQPQGFKDYALDFAGTAGPTEVALCLSYQADDGESTSARRRGRIYIPMLGNTPRPTDGNLNSINNLGDDLAAVGTASNTTWLMYSQSNNTTYKIERISCDDAWDTQRRRGMAATKRYGRDVQ